ncbi:MAG: shikimate dehydrogenase [Lachnospiraceae bacterium]|nr:shikimate dehydrogenase [Lachnospiraceae bacterium]
MSAKYGLLGEHLSHSYSKQIHEALADYTYELIPLSREELTKFMTAKEFAAVNVTIPYKREVIPYLDSMDERAKSIGAVNTVVNRGGKLEGYNTDYDGFLYTLRKNKIDVTGKKVAVIGNGGAAQAVLAVLRGLSVKELVIVDIIPGEGVCTYEDLHRLHTDADVLVNTSPVGMYPKVDASPLDLTPFKKLTAVIDIVYNPNVTKLLAQAASLGLTAVNGLQMLVAQAFFAAQHFLDTKLDEKKIEEVTEMIRKTLG